MEIKPAIPLAQVLPMGDLTDWTPEHSREYIVLFDPKFQGETQTWSVNSSEKVDFQITNLSGMDIALIMPESGADFLAATDEKTTVSISGKDLSVQAVASEMKQMANL